MTPAIVDACVMRSSGDVDAAHPIAETCRDLLNSLRANKRPLAVSPDIEIEWDRHMSRYARKWLVSMLARNLIKPVQPPHLRAIRKAISSCAKSHGERALMIKDIHLIEAVYATDGPVISMDYAVRDAYRTHYSVLGFRKHIHWTCPLAERLSDFIWLASETKYSPTRLLFAPTPITNKAKGTKKKP